MTNCETMKPLWSALEKVATAIIDRDSLSEFSYIGRFTEEKALYRITVLRLHGSDYFQITKLNSLTGDFSSDTIELKENTVGLWIAQDLALEVIERIPVMVKEWLEREERLRESLSTLKEKLEEALLLLKEKQ